MEQANAFYSLAGLLVRLRLGMFILSFEKRLVVFQLFNQRSAFSFLHPFEDPSQAQFLEVGEGKFLRK